MRRPALVCTAAACAALAASWLIAGPLDPPAGPVGPTYKTLSEIEPRSANGQGAAGGAGIHMVSGDSRVEGNNCAAQLRGIDVDGTGNIILRNACSGNTYAGSLGSTDPSANFTYWILATNPEQLQTVLISARAAKRVAMRNPG